MAAQEINTAAIWNQGRINQTKTPVIVREGGSEPLKVRLPYNADNRVWLSGDHRHQPKWIAQHRYWEMPKSRFDNLIRRSLDRFGRVYVMQPYRVQEKCAPACWNARGFECECSCMGANHGGGHPIGNWRVISETFAFRWQDRQLACRLIERHPAHTAEHAAELSEDREEEDHGEIEAILHSQNRTLLEPPAEDWIEPQEGFRAVDQAEDQPLLEEVADQSFPTSRPVGTRLASSETEAQQRPNHGRRAVRLVANSARGLITAIGRLIWPR